MAERKANGSLRAKEQIERVFPESAAQAIKVQMRSVSIPIEERVAIEDHINNMAREMEYLLDGIDGIPNADQKKILDAYKKFLKENLDLVNNRLGKLGGG